MTARMTPFEVLYGHPPPPILRYEHGLTAVSEVDTQLKERNVMLSTLKESLTRAQHRMMKIANANHQDVEYVVEDWVYLKLHPYHQTSLSHYTHPKLAPQYIHSFQVIAKVGMVAYKLALPPIQASILSFMSQF